MTITIIGHGYVGIVAACVFADFGNTVYVIGHTPEKLQRLRDGDPLIYEPGLAEMLVKNNKAGRLIFTDRYDEALAASQIVFSAVGTPPKADTGEADLSTVFSVAKHIGQHLSPDHFTVVSCKSTVPVGTNKKVENIILEELKARGLADKAEQIFAVASCPEFLREGTGIYDTLNPDRTIIGSENDQATALLLELHKPLPGKRVVTNLASAELIKYAANSMLATKISFANLISLYAEATGADAPSVLEAVGLDERIGQRSFQAGIGYGGACFPKDVKALIATGQSHEVDTSLLDSVEQVNDLVWQNFVKKVQKVAGDLRQTSQPVTVGIWGLAFKPDTDDIRFAPSLKIIDTLAGLGYVIKAYDPVAMDNVKKAPSGKHIQFQEDAYGAAAGVDILCICTEWREFREIDLHRVKASMRQLNIVDGRNIYDPKEVRSMGFNYLGTGR